MKATYQGNEIRGLYYQVTLYRDMLAVSIENAKILADVDIRIYKETPLIIRLFKTNPDSVYNMYCSKAVRDLRRLCWKMNDIKQILDKIYFALTTNASSITIDDNELRLLNEYNDK